MIRKVAFLGAGALGAVYATRFLSCPEFTPVFIASSHRALQLQKDGVVVNGTTNHIQVVQPGAKTEPADLIIVALKHHHLQDALPDLAPFVGDHTIMMSVMNGLDSERIIGERYGMEKILYAIAVGIDALRAGNHISYTKIGTIMFGEARNQTITPRVSAVRNAFTKAGIGCEVPVDMIRALWWKFMVNVGTNQASAVTGMPYGAFQTSPDAQALMESLMQEVIDLAVCAGVNLVNQDIDDWYTFLNTLSPHGKTSMLQDIEAKRKTEVDIFAGKVVDLGAQYHLPTPVNQTVLRIIKVLENTF